MPRRRSSDAADRQALTKKKKTATAQANPRSLRKSCPKIKHNKIQPLTQTGSGRYTAKPAVRRNRQKSTVRLNRNPVSRVGVRSLFTKQPSCHLRFSLHSIQSQLRDVLHDLILDLDALPDHGEPALVPPGVVLGSRRGEKGVPKQVRQRAGRTRVSLGSATAASVCDVLGVSEAARGKEGGLERGMCLLRTITPYSVARYISTPGS